MKESGRRGSETEARRWLLHLLSGWATVRDARAFRQWCLASPQHAQAFVRARQLWDQLASAAQRYTSK